MIKSEFTGFGFAAGDVRGTRAWKVDSLGRLTGVTFPQVWRPGENLSECKRTREKARNVRAYDPPRVETVCTCGDSSCSRYRRSFSQRHQATYQHTYSGLSWSFASFAGFETEPHPCDGMDPKCACGFYAYQEGSNDYYKPKGDRSSLMGMPDSGRVPVGGVVRGYGKTVLGTRGFRSEKAEILALYVDDDSLSGVSLTMRLARLYQVKVFSDYAAMLAEFPPTPPEGAGDPADEDFWTRSAS